MRSGSATICAPSSAGSATRTDPGRRSAGRAGSARISRRLRPVMSRALEDAPARPSARASRRIARPSRRLAAARLADDAERLARLHRRLTPVDRPHLADGVLEDARLDREVLDEPVDLEDHVLVRSLGSRGADRRLGRSVTRSPAAASVARVARRPAPRRSGTPTVFVGLVDVAAAALGARRLRPLRMQAARMERAPGRPADQARRLARDRLEPVQVAVHRGRLVEQAERVRVPRRVEDRVDVADLDDPAGVHDDDAVGELGDHARDRG